LPAPARTLLRAAAIRQRAAALGIDKIDVAEDSGYVQFSDDAAVDPLTLVRLVQNEGRIYRMRGAHRLQFAGDFAKLDARIAGLETLLGELERGSPPERKAMTG